MSEAHRFSCLLVEDVEAMRSLLRLLLKGMEYEVVEAASLNAARRKLRSESEHFFDFVILDLELPDGNGLELMPEIDQSIRVIALTADDSQEARLQCRHAGCELVLSKSDELGKLKAILATPSEPASGQPREFPASSYPYICYLAEARLELREARRRSDFLGLRRIAHRLRGTAVHFGHPGIGRTAKAISSALARGNLEQAHAETEALIARIGDVLELNYVRIHAGPLMQSSTFES